MPVDTRPGLPLTPLAAGAASRLAALIAPLALLWLVIGWALGWWP